MSKTFTIGRFHDTKMHRDYEIDPPVKVELYWNNKYKSYISKRNKHNLWTAAKSYRKAIEILKNSIAEFHHGIVVRGIYNKESAYGQFVLNRVKEI